GPGLAAGARERRAVHEVLAPDGRAAPRAGAPGLAAGGQRAVEVARGAVDVDVERVEARAALAERLAHHRGCVVEQLADARLGERARDPLAVQLRAPQRLVGVDVADARGDGLVEQHPLDRAALALDLAHDRGPVVGR